MSKYHERLNVRGKLWQRLRRRVFVRDRYRCRECQRPGRLECDHLVPLESGGDPWGPANLQTLCRGCHVRKTVRENEESRVRKMTPAELRWRALVAATLARP